MMDTVTSPINDQYLCMIDDDCNWQLTDIHGEVAKLAAMDSFWETFEAEAESLPLFTPAQTDDEDLDELLDWSVGVIEHKENIVHHDCMWAGSCDDKMHPGNGCIAALPQPSMTSADSIQPGRSLLRVQKKSICMTSPIIDQRSESPMRPDTPLSLDEDETPTFKHIVDIASTAKRLIDCSAVAADHSYTLIKPPTKHARMDNLGVQTPSDSEEEIDVVSLGEKTVAPSIPLVRSVVSLPTNPSPYDCHELQRTVATAITRPRETIAKKQISRTPPKRSRRSNGGRRARNGAAKRRSRISSDSEVDVADSERRVLHNDMERMRRIGLKNLFDQLKMQVPSTRDKERAPKVVILREAASLCRRLAAEDRERETLRRQQARLLARVRRLRTQLASGR